ncbi:titin isoform X1 [Pogonomyrmex barbatus]|uniref:glycogenin glucosyltransferase n=1 Tax=Pogonomyrmex barbatus TaxID=144034 RepID=A0A6I9WFR5_9HYME|nr:titin isoform X1 [Pogonomyrmex barbatus]
MGGYAWVTLATNDAYSLGALVLAHSLRRVGTKHELACLITPGVTAIMREKLAEIFSFVQEVNVLDSKDEANLALLARPELGITFTKLHCWRLTQYEKCVFVDADTLVVRNCDELFEREELSAAPDVGWPDCFNSGVFVFRPSQQTFASIIAFAAAKGSFDGGDQGLLNMYFSDWATKDISKHLPFIYNMCSTATYSYLPAFKQFGDDVRIIHFIGITKPWLQYFDTLTGTVQPPPGSAHLQSLLQLWWNIFCERVHPQLTPSMATSTLAPIWHAFALPSYVPPFPREISNYSDEAIRNTYNSRTPDFSEFKDPWEEYSPRNDSFLTDGSALSGKDNSCYCEIKYEKEPICQSDHNTSQPEHNKQFHHEQQHSSCASIQKHDQYQEHVISHSEENNQEHFVQQTEHHTWQQFSEQRYHVEQYQHNEQYQWKEQRHHHVHQHHEPRHHNEHHQYHENKASDYHVQHQLVYEQQPTEVRHETRAQHYADSGQTSHQDADHHSHIISHNESHAQHINSHHAQDNFASHYCRCKEQHSEQVSEAVNKQTDTRRIDFLPSPSPIPCTDLHNVATRSDPKVTEHLDNANAGIAGALAQITLGEARSAEQIALEEHMRKQSWEQGQIDYMGRDSFDNIWKKICETLSLVPQRQLTPPKEDIAISEPAVTQTVDASVSVEVEKSAVEADKDPTQCLVCEIPKEEKLPMAQIPEQEAPVLPSGESVTVETAATKVASEPVQLEAVCVKPTTESKDVKVCEIEVPPPKLPVEPLPAKIISECKLASPQATQETAPQSESLLETKEPQQTDLQVSTYLLADAVCKLVQVATPVAKIDDTSAPIEAKPETPTSVVPDATQSATLISPQVTVPSVASEAPMEDAAKRVVESMPDVTQPLTIDPSERHAEMLLAASEISTVSPVPIQVAESVLQAEPKESVLDAAVTVSDQAIATTVTAVHEFTDVASVPTPVESVQLNGSACEAEKRGDVTTMAAIIPDTPEKTDAPMTTAAVIPDIPEKTDVPAEVTKASILLTTKNVPSEPPKVTEEKILGEVVPSEASSVEKLAEQVARTEAKSPEQMAKIEETKPAELIIKMETTETKPPEQKIEAMKEESVVKTEVAEAIAKQPETITQAEPALEAMPTKQAEVAEAERLPSQVPGSPIQVPGSPIQVPGSPIQVPGSPTQIPESPTQVPESPTQVPKSPIAEQSSPMESIEAKPSSIPLTPMVTEAPSPSVESTQEAEETAKKSLKKSDSAEGADGESADKKGAKKAVKKVTKKPKTKADEAVSSTATEGVTADSSQKAKKTVKTTKKIGTKTLETDTSVPETPPPSSADAVGPDTPVPPKRKTKSTNAKGTTGKKEAEE